MQLKGLRQNRYLLPLGSFCLGSSFLSAQLAVAETVPSLGETEAIATVAESPLAEKRRLDAVVESPTAPQWDPRLSPPVNSLSVAGQPSQPRPNLLIPSPLIPGVVPPEVNRPEETAPASAVDSAAREQALDLFRDSDRAAQRLLKASQALLTSLETSALASGETVETANPTETVERVEIAAVGAVGGSDGLSRQPALAELSTPEPMDAPSEGEGAPSLPEPQPEGVVPPDSEPTGDFTEVIPEADSPDLLDPPLEEPPAETAGEDLPTVPQDETLIPTPSQEVAPSESLPPAVLDEMGDEAEDMPDDEAVEEQGDPELGVLRLRKQPLSLTQPPIKVPVYVLASASYLSNSNTRASEDPIEDQLFRSTVAITASPILGRRTAAYATVQGNLFRYGDLSRLDYNELRFRAGIRHVLRSRVIGELGWTNRQLYFRESGDRFLSDNSVFGTISRRDPGILGKKTSLNSFYRVRASFADPKTSNRVVNTLGTTLSYDVTPRIKASLTGLGVVTSFTKQSRHDIYGQALASLSYTLAKNTRLSIFAALNRGGSADDRVDFDNALLGVSFSSSLKLF